MQTAFLVFRSMFLHTPHECILNVVIGLVPLKTNTTFNNGSLGSRIDEERSEMR